MCGSGCGDGGKSSMVEAILALAMLPQLGNVGPSYVGPFGAMLGILRLWKAVLGEGGATTC